MAFFKTKIEIDSDTADHIVSCSLKDSIKTLRKEIKTLKGRAKHTEWDKRQLAEDIIEVSAMEKVYYFYTGKAFK